MHRECPSVGATVPGRHVDGCDRPPAHEEPMGQGTQSSLLVNTPRTYVPASHDAGIGVAELCGQNAPDGQFLQLDWPFSSW